MTHLYSGRPLVPSAAVPRHLETIRGGRRENEEKGGEGASEVSSLLRLSISDIYVRLCTASH
jgi:hypothetical protein